MVAKLGIPGLTPHNLRHSHATSLLLNNVHPKVVQERLGHSSIDVTINIYSHVAPSLQQEAASITDIPARS
ncbi:tyrosine-type recombinase/integrase [Metallumcola ferriviriculae]|uniref:Tyrosine-type recombinase/integrase n=2 Tax=Metallumcola ferriviriculae TaxID=3039180 RepID=A0AAU0UL50_9FIRM|nr:tyrosine-type recombinase/integrase [Desulfitibacteraceae bacterium MK1]